MLESRQNKAKESEPFPLPLSLSFSGLARLEENTQRKEG
uniref:Uncharacterized protein n=1 Tax=Nelumbo nucifera TaxID=4432 RepID=A0A822ZXP6_NELNU|nr:TPA_asm: hypothetical protein HUJ06_017553 [Nelumbo nucifera]